MTRDELIAHARNKTMPDDEIIARAKASMEPYFRAVIERLEVNGGRAATVAASRVQGMEETAEWIRNCAAVGQAMGFLPWWVGDVIRDAARAAADDATQQLLAWTPTGPGH